MFAKLWINILSHLTNHPNSSSEIALDGEPMSSRRASHCGIFLLELLTHKGVWEMCCPDGIVARCFGKNFFLLFQDNKIYKNTYFLYKYGFLASSASSTFSASSPNP